MGPAFQFSDQNLAKGNFRQCFHHLFIMFFLSRRLFILQSCYDGLCIRCEPKENVTKEGRYKNINYLVLVSESKKTLENSASMIIADAEAGKMPS